MLPQLIEDRIFEIFKKNKKENKYVGIHCTHGINRTGLIVCKYLIKIHNMKP